MTVLARADEIGARIDRLPASRAIWRLVALLSFGAFFEIYDLSLTPFISPALVEAGVFRKGAAGLFGLSDQASFAAATFAGLWIGTLLFSFAADRLGRRPVFAFSLLWYCAATVLMGLQNDAVSVDLWRLVAGIGTGTQLVTIDCYLAEITPKQLRGRAFTVSTCIQFAAYPVCGLLAVALGSRGALGIAGWRWLAFVPALGAIGAWWVQRALPESPRWLAERGRLDEALRTVRLLEERSPAAPAPVPASPAVIPSADVIEPARLPARTYRARIGMLILFQILQTIGYYGFNNWAPSLLEARGIDLKHSLTYVTAVAFAFPLSPLLFFAFADRIERKWQVAAGAFFGAVFGLLFAVQHGPAGLIACGIGIAVAGNLMSYGYHAYQSELFPTRIRAKAVGLTYSFSRVSAIFSSYLIAYVLKVAGPTDVFVVIASCLFAVAALIAAAGPRTNRRALEEIAL